MIIKEAGSLTGLVRWDTSDFRRIPGIGRVKALQLSVYTEIAKRIAQGNRIDDLILDDPHKVWNLLYPEAISESVEKVWVLCLDRKNRVLRTEKISSGTATGNLVHPREVFRPAVRWSASAIILAHNHPSGDPTPSASDLQVTRRFQQLLSSWILISMIILLSGSLPTPRLVADITVSPIIISSDLLFSYPFFTSERILTLQRLTAKESA